MEVKVSNLKDRALDWAVSYCRQGHTPHVRPYSTNWAYGGPIIECKKINLRLHTDTDKEASAFMWRNHAPAFRMRGPTSLTAAMRCFVLSELGDTVDIPEGFL